MEDPRWLRIVTVGLVLAALAVGYFLLTGRFNSNNQTKPINQVTTQTSPTPAPTRIPNVTPPTPLATPDPRRNITTLPRTGYFQFILGIISVGIMISGLGLRKFPN